MLYRAPDRLPSRSPWLMRRVRGKQLLVVAPVADEFDAAVHLPDGVLVVLGEVAGYADKTGVRPVHGDRLVEPLPHQHLEVATVVHEPVQVEQTLGDHVLVDGALVLEDDGVAVLIDAERVHPTTVLDAGGVLAGQEANPEERFHVVLDEGLQGLLQSHRRTDEFGRLALVEPEQLQIPHGRPSVVARSLMPQPQRACAGRPSTSRWR
jgi:hypothetical protein